MPWQYQQAHKIKQLNYLLTLCVKRNCLQNADYIGYSTAHKEAKYLFPEEIINDKAAYPLLEELDSCVIFKDLGDFTKEYDRIWTEIMAQ